MEPVQLAAVLAAAILLASIVSVELGITVALVELTLGIALGNAFDIQSQQWLDLLASFASIVLTFLAGMEVDPSYMRRRLGASLGIGTVSFAGPFVVASLVAYLALDWSGKASLIAGTALSTTSLAVVYAVLVERGLTTSDIGKLLMSATFVTDLLTALALSLIFIKPSPWFPLFLMVSVGLILALPRIAPWFFGRYGDRVIEPEIKLVFFCLLVLMVLASAANGHAVLPAFVLGLVMSNHYAEHREEQKRLRVVAFAMLTPFFFIKGGLNVSLSAVFSNLGVLAAPARGEDGAEARARLPGHPPGRSHARDVRNAAHEYGPHVRNDRVDLRADRRDHRYDAVLAPRDRRRAVCDRADGNCRALVPAGG